MNDPLITFVMVIIKLIKLVFIYLRDFVRAQKYKTEAETFGWSFVFQDFVTAELKSKVTQRIEVLRHDSMQTNNIKVFKHRQTHSFIDNKH